MRKGAYNENSLSSDPMQFCFTVPAFAQWPEKPITIIVPWAAGGNTDTVVLV